MKTEQTEQTEQSLPNYRLVKVKYLPHAYKRGARVKLWTAKRYKGATADSLTVAYCYETASVLRQATELLNKAGFNPVCVSDELDYYLILCEWGDDFKLLREIKL